MARYRASIEVPGDPEATFAYMAEFTNVAEWDPGIAAARRATPGELGRGTAFEVDVALPVGSTTLCYEVVAYDPPKRVTLEAVSPLLRSLDTITCEAAPGGGTRLTYDAELTLRGPLGLADPLLAVGFRRVADRALAGLRERLGARPA